MVSPTDIEELKRRAVHSCMGTKGPHDREGEWKSLGFMVGFTYNPTAYRAVLHPRIRAVVDAVFEKDETALAQAKADLAIEIQRIDKKSSVGPFYSNVENIQTLMNEMVYNIGRFTTHLQNMEAAEEAAIATGEPSTVVDSATAETHGRQSGLFKPSHPRIPPIDHRRGRR